MDSDKIIDEEMQNLEFRRLMQRATIINDRVETFLENPEYLVFSRIPRVPDSSDYSHPLKCPRSSPLS